MDTQQILPLQRWNSSNCYHYRDGNPITVTIAKMEGHNCYRDGNHTHVIFTGTEPTRCHHYKDANPTTVIITDMETKQMLPFQIWKPNHCYHYRDETQQKLQFQR